MSIEKKSSAEWYSVKPRNGNSLLSIHYMLGFKEDKSIVETVEIFDASDGRYLAFTSIDGIPTRENAQYREELGRLESNIIDALKELPPRIRSVVFT